jgi:hypothetical protein
VNLLFVSESSISLSLSLPLPPPSLSFYPSVSPFIPPIPTYFPLFYLVMMMMMMMIITYDYLPILYISQPCNPHVSHPLHLYRLTYKHMYCIPTYSPTVHTTDMQVDTHACITTGPSQVFGKSLELQYS